MNKEIVISIKTILFTLLLLLVGYVVYRLGPIIAILVVAGILMISLENTIQKLMKFTLFNRPIPRSLAVIMVYALLILFMVVVLTIGVPPVISQGQKLIQNLIVILDQFKLTNSVDLSLASLLPQFSSVSGGVIAATISIFNNIATVFSVLVISIYLSLDWPNLKKKFFGVIPEKYKDEVEHTVKDVETSVGHWLKGEATLMTIVGTLSFAGLVALEVDFALALAIIAGVLEAVPMIGPLVAAVIASIIGFSMSTGKGLLVVALFVLIQQLENNFIVPRVMGKVAGFSPLVILLAFLVGSTLFGIVGALLAVPSTIILGVIVKHVLRYSLKTN